MTLLLTACDPTAGIAPGAEPVDAAVVTVTPRSASALSAADATAERAVVGLASTAPPMELTGPCFAGGCHAELKSREQPYKHRPYVDEQCRDCHTQFHTGPTQRLYAQSDIELCYTCHPQEGLGVTHPVGEGVVDPNTGQMMTCTSTCHLGHTAPYPYLLALPGDGALCISCHQDFVSK